jgi:hypothetical protein
VSEFAALVTEPGGREGEREGERQVYAVANSEASSWAAAIRGDDPAAQNFRIREWASRITGVDGDIPDTRVQ